jgi:hypothetical protein
MGQKQKGDCEGSVWVAGLFVWVVVQQRSRMWKLIVWQLVWQQFRMDNKYMHANQIFFY